MRRALPFGFIAIIALCAATASPRIDGITPAQGPIAGGTEVTVTGVGFAGATVRLDNQTVAPSAQSDNEIHLRMPAHDNGYTVISIRSGTNTTYGEFLYIPPALADLPAGCITTVAGIGHYVRDFGPAANTVIAPAGLAFDANGNLYIAEPGNNQIARVRPDGMIERVTAPGSGAPGPDGILAADATVSFPRAVAVDPSGNIYIPDQRSRLRKIDAITGIISSIAGDGVSGYAGDNGPASQARIGAPTHIAADANDVFFIDYSDGEFSQSRTQRIRRIHFADGHITTFAGTGMPGFSGDGGPATLAQFDTGNSDNGHLTLDPAGNLFLADTGNHRIRRIDRSTGVISTFYPLPTDGSHPAYVGQVRSIAFDLAGNLYYGGSGRIVKLSLAGAFLKAWGNGQYALPVEGAPAASAGLGHITGLAIDPAGNIFFSDDAIGRVRRIDIATDQLFTVAGIGPAIIGETGPATATTVAPRGLAVDHHGNLLVADSLRLRRIDHTGTITTIAGTGSFVGQPAPILATQYVLSPNSVGVDANGEIEMANLSVIAHLDPDGILREIAGRNSIDTYTGDGGLATAATLCQSFDCVRDAQGNLLIADTNNNRIRRVDAGTGIITTIVGNGGPVNGYEHYGAGQSGGDGGPAATAAINTPYGVAVDSSGNLYIAEDLVIRKVDLAGVISTFAPIAHAGRLVFDTTGNLYALSITAVFKIDAAGNHTLIAGSGTSSGDAGFAGDGGPALQGKLFAGSQSAGIAIDHDGNVYFCDDNRVRAIRLATLPLSPPIIFTHPANQAVTAGNSVTFTTAANGSPTPTYQWKKNGTNIAGATNATLTLTNVQMSAAGTYTVVATNSVGFTTSNGAVLTVTAAPNLPTVRTDFDADGRTEPLWRNTISTQVTSWTTGTGFTVFGAESDGWAVIGAGDFDGDGKADVLWHNTASGLVASWPSAGGFQVYGVEGDGWAVIDTGDFDGDGKADVLWHNTSNGLVVSWTTGAGFQVYGVEGGGWAVIQTGDFDGDGKTDVLWHNTSSGLVASWPSAGGFQVYGVESDGWAVIQTGDFDGDGKADVLWHNTTSGVVASWTTDAGFQVYGVEGDGWAVIQTGDFDGDGKADVLWRNTINGIVASWTSGGGFSVFGTEGGGWLVIHF